MSSFIFDDFARITLGGARNVADGKPLTPAQIERVINYLKSPGSGPDGTTSYAEYLNKQMHTHPPELPPGKEYIGFSGTDAVGKPNFDNAAQYVKDTGKRSGIIGDTPWGKFIEQTDIDPKFAVIEDKFKVFMDAQGLKPRGSNYLTALQDMMWNAGSPEYFENALASGRPMVAFVENAPEGRGFSELELGTARKLSSKYPNAIINGYTLRAITADPDPKKQLEFARKSATEYMQLEETIADTAKVKVGQVRSKLNLIEGYDAANKTLFGQPVDEFKSLSFDKMVNTRTTWAASRTGVTPGLRSPTAETPPKQMLEPGVSPKQALKPGALPEQVPGAVEAALPKGMSRAGIAGFALMMAYDCANTGHKYFELRSQGNDTGADSAWIHFAGRTGGGLAGSIAGGFVAGAGYGLMAGSEAGPGALATGLIGGVIGGVYGAYRGEKWAEQRDNDKIFIQTDKNGNEWHRDPSDPKGPWTLSTDAQQPKAGAEGDTVYKDGRYQATGSLEQQLNYQSANESYKLGLANPAKPRDPYSIPSEQDQPGWWAGNWNRDARTGMWSRMLAVQLSESPIMETQQATPEQAAALEKQSQVIVAENAANTPAAVAARYQIAYNQFGWERYGLVPDAVKNAAASVGTLRASDGNDYTRSADGEWTSKGLLYDSKAEGNIRNELNAVSRSQQAGLAYMAAIAKYAKEHSQLEPTVRQAPSQKDMPVRSAKDAVNHSQQLSRDDMAEEIAQFVAKARPQPEPAGPNISRQELRPVQDAANPQTDKPQRVGAEPANQSLGKSGAQAFSGVVDTAASGAAYNQSDAGRNQPMPPAQDMGKKRLLVMNGQRILQAEKGGVWTDQEVGKANGLKPNFYNLYLGQAADKKQTYTGVFVHADAEKVYQETGRNRFVVHARKDFDETPEIGSAKSISYDTQGKANVSEAAATITLSRGRGLSR